MFELHTESAPTGLAPLGQVVEIRELAYGPMRDAMQASEGAGQSAERLLGASLYVDGQPIGYEAVRALPGRFSSAIGDALQQCLRMHGLVTDAEKAADAAADPAAGPKA